MGALRHARPPQLGASCRRAARRRRRRHRARPAARAPPRPGLSAQRLEPARRSALTGSMSGGSVYREGALLGSNSALGDAGVAHGEWWRIITGGFLHENLIHIGFNMYVLYVLGQMLEPALGQVRFGVIYAVAL